MHFESSPLSPTEAEQLAHKFAALSDPSRIRIFSLIAHAHDPISVSELTEHTDLSQPTVSHHLKKLTEAQLLKRNKHGRTVTHEIQQTTLKELQAFLNL